MKVVVTIPTYNEKENIKALIKALDYECAKILKHQVTILVVDGNSPDGTAREVSNLKSKVKNCKVELLVKEKQGLGVAYAQGFKHALKNLGADLVFEFDGDGSHQPKYIPKFIKAIEEGADVAVGSRYIKGGSIPPAWARHRKVFSFLGNLVARLVFLTPQYYDLTTGFRATKAKYLKRINFNWLSSGFAYKLELFWGLYKLGAKIVEVPIEFLDRKKGKSKIARNEILDSLRVVLTLRLRDSQRFIKFAVVGGLGLFLQTVVFELLLRSHLPFVSFPPNASVIGGELAIISNFTWNNLWTFRDRKLNRWRIPFKFLQFNLTSFGALVIQWVTLRLGIFLLGESFLVVRGFFVLGLVLTLIWNYTMYNKLIWKKQ